MITERCFQLSGGHERDAASEVPQGEQEQRVLRGAAEVRARLPDQPLRRQSQVPGEAPVAVPRR